MESRWVRRKSHVRHLRSGDTIFVRANWARYDKNVYEKNRRYQRQCPMCNARILTVHMPNGGWAHFEAAKGLTRVKHPCLHRGEGLPKGLDELTLDLFENSSIVVPMLD